MGKCHRRMGLVFGGGLTTLLLLPLTMMSGQAAERINLRYLFFKGSVSVAALEAYAKDGTLPPELSGYTQYLQPQILTRLRGVLQERIEVEPEVLKQFLHTATGESLLQRVSQVIQAESDRTSYKMLRSALISAASDPAGLTALSVLRNFPDSGIQINLEAAINIFQQVQELVQQTQGAIAVVQRQSQQEAVQPLLAPPLRPALDQPGPYTWEKRSWQLTDDTQRRLQLTGKAQKFKVDLYLPQLSQTQAAPVLVISHGLGSDQSTFAYLAQHLASQGFAVAVPEHPGSSSAQMEVLLQGSASRLSAAQEFVDRPLDVSYLLDELTQRTQTDPNLKQRLNLQQVGVLGQSFGGYTALALVGAQLNFAQLEQDCQGLQNSLNLSLLLQCQVLELPKRTYTFTDPRIKAAIAVNPLTSSVFGQEGLRQVQQPVMLVSSSADTVTPPLSEQIQPFTWLTGSQKYLALIEDGSHFSVLGASHPDTHSVNLPTELVGPAPEVAQRYLSALSTGFFQANLGQPEPGFRWADQIQRLSQPVLPLHLIQSLSPETLQTGIAVRLQSNP